MTQVTKFDIQHIVKKLSVSLSEIKKKYYTEGKSQDKIAADLKVSQWVISDRMRKNGIPRLKRTRKLNPWKYRINHNAFDNLNIHTSWWIGWMVSDGFVLNDRRFGLKVSIRDIDIIEKLKSFLKYTGPIYKQRDKIKDRNKVYLQAAIIPTSYRIVDKLNEYGIIPNKSLTIRFPKSIADSNEDLIRPFIRGIFEGDGSLLHDKNKSLVFQIVGTYEICNGVQQQFMKFVGVEKTKLSHNTRNSNHYALRYRGRIQVLNIMRWLYYNAGKDMLDRKFDIYLALMHKLL